MKRMSLSTKLVVAFIVVGLLPVLGMGITSCLKATKALHKRSVSQLISIRDIKKAQIEKYFKERQSDLNVLVQTVASLRNEAFNKLELDIHLKKKMLEDFFNRVFKDVEVLSRTSDVLRLFKELKLYGDLAGFSPEGPFDISSDKAGYDSIARKYEKKFKEYIKTQGYYDFFLICAKHGHVMFTVEKEPDLGTNLAYGPYKKEGLANLWRKVVKTRKISIVDFAPYTPSKGQQAAFVGAPVFDRQGKLVGVVAIQLPTEPIHNILHLRKGLGNTGETFVVAAENGRVELRSDQIIRGGKIGDPVEENYIIELYNDTRQSGMDVKTNRKNNLDIVYFGSLNIPGLNWKIFSVISYEEAISPKLAGEREDFYTKYVKKYGYYDLFLIHPEGKIFYTVAHEPDYGTNIIKGKYSNSNLGKLVRRVLKSRNFGFADFEPYAPSKNEPASFIAMPLIINNKVEIIVALQISLKGINEIMQLRSGMGKTGESYLVGPDKLMRSDSYLDPTFHTVKASFANPARGRVDTLSVREALAGRSGCKVIKDYRGSAVLSAYTPIKIDNTTWALISEIDQAEAFSAIKKLKASIAITSLTGLILIISVALFLSRSIANPIKKVATNLGESANQVASASGEVATVSQQLAEGASEQAASIEEVSSSVEEMSSMTRQNAENASQADKLMKTVVKTAEEAKQTMTRLLNSMDKITRSSEETQKIIKTIDEIAFQTNLLALNAAVEAARAGEAGAGFAVVADEVRNLALRAAEAAKNTAELIQQTVVQVKEGFELTTATNEAFSAVHDNLNKVVELVDEIAAASREQAEGIEQINKATGEMDKVVQQTAASAEESASAAEELSAQAEQLKNLVAELARIVSGSNKATLTDEASASRKKAIPAKSSIE